MTYKHVSFLHLFLFFCVTKCASQYHSNPHSHIYGRRHWNYSAKATNESTPTPTDRPDRPNRVKITLYYETLCPASVQYLKDILRPAVEQLAPHLDVHLVPYGHAQTRYINKRYKFNCQHGYPECYGNRLHACAIDVIHNTTKSTLFNACLVEHTALKEEGGYDYFSALTTCAEKLNASSENIWQCLNTRRGVILQKRFGDETHRLPQLQYVPYVLVDGMENVPNGNLIPVICSKLNPAPRACIRRITNHDNTRTHRWNR